MSREPSITCPLLLLEITPTRAFSLKHRHHSLLTFLLIEAKQQQGIAGYRKLGDEATDRHFIYSKTKYHVYYKAPVTGLSPKLDHRKHNLGIAATPNLSTDSSPSLRRIEFGCQILVSYAVKRLVLSGRDNQPYHPTGDWEGSIAG